ncbi:hypothetical protein CesoFtcFv8_004669 [Champsocephalus esox]|uniref:Uncharacterized protein n=1 Tax=Champsocephalus esox TaxID=159716 RepID=A0AAN8H8K2_9TELE|nr:hypothetical protein CesoFtcFv8_004669 [Champsocephalus esox]
MGEESQHVSILTHQKGAKKATTEESAILEGRGSAPRPHLHSSQREDNSISTCPSSLFPPLLLQLSAMLDLLLPAAFWNNTKDREMQARTAEMKR